MTTNTLPPGVPWGDGSIQGATAIADDEPEAGQVTEDQLGDPEPGLLLLPLAAVLVLSAECGRRAGLPGYSKAPRDRRDTNGDMWTAGHRDERYDAEGNIEQRAGIYLTKDTAQATVAMARDSLRRVTQQLQAVTQERKSLIKHEEGSRQTFESKKAAILQDRRVVEVGGEVTLEDTFSAEYTPKHTARIEHLAAMEAELKRDERRLMAEAEQETITYYFPPDAVGVLFAVDAEAV